MNRQEIEHTPDWYSQRWQLRHGYEFRVCKVCLATEDVHLPAPSGAES